MVDLSKMRDLCNILGISLLQRLRDEVDDSVGDIGSWLASDLGVGTINRLDSSVERLLKVRLERFNELKKRAFAILSYWDAIPVPFEEKQEFVSLIYYVDVDFVDEITEANALSLEFINKVEKEYDRLHGQINDLIQKKKSKHEKILKSTHLTPSSIDKVADNSDPIVALADVRSKISAVKALASKRAGIVTKIELLHHANEEIRYEASKKDGVPYHDVRSTNARFLKKARPKLISKLEAELQYWSGVFKYDEVDAEYVLGTAHQERGTEKGTTMDDRGKTVEDKAGASAEKSMEGDKATGVEDMQVDRQNPLPPLPQFGRKAPRTPRVPVQAAPQLPDSDGSAESVRSTSSERSDESMSRTDPDDSDYDPKTPSEATQ